MPKDDPRWVERVRDLKELVAAHARHEEEVDFRNCAECWARRQRSGCRLTCSAKRRWSCSCAHQREGNVIGRPRRFQPDICPSRYATFS
jgi:hypothetical protein